MKNFILVLMLFSFMGCASLAGPSKKEKQTYVDSHFYLTSQVRQCILEGKITKGMTMEEVIASWGRPRDINKSVGSWGVHEQWVYGGTSHTSYLYFENGTLTSWQN